MQEADSPYDQLGGETAIRTLVNRFYDLMDSLSVVQEIRHLHPQDLMSSRDKLFKFLSGWLGGPQLYIEEYGHPRLRRRHLPFPIGERERDQWLLCMNQALDERVASTELRHALKQAFAQTADHMRNQQA